MYAYVLLGEKPFSRHTTRSADAGAKRCQDERLRQERPLERTYEGSLRQWAATASVTAFVAAAIEPRRRQVSALGRVKLAGENSSFSAPFAPEAPCNGRYGMVSAVQFAAIQKALAR